MSMPEHIKEFKEALESGSDMDFIANNGYRFSKDELIAICKELFYTMYQDAHDPCHDPKECDGIYKSMIGQFMENMNEYECGFFQEEAYV